MAKGKNQGLDLGAMFAGINPIDQPAEQAAPQHETIIDNNYNINNNSNIENKTNKNNIKNTGTGKRGRPPKVETNDNVERVNRTFTVDLALWQDLQHLARIFNKPVSEYLEELMRAAVKKNAAILDSVKQLKS